MTERPNHALQRTRRERRGCNRYVPCAGSLSLGRSARKMEQNRIGKRLRGNSTIGVLYHQGGME